MKPGVVKWASNDDFATGPDGTAPTKAPPTATQRQEGYYPSVAPAPQIWNHERWAYTAKLMEGSSTRLMRWFQGTSWAGAGGTERGDGFYCPVADTHLFMSSTAGGGLTEHNSMGGLIWGAGVAPPNVGGPGYPRFAHDNLGNMGVTMGVACPPYGGVYYRVGFGGVWATPAGFWDAATAPGTWSRIAHDHIGLWAMGDDSGHLIYVTDGPATVMAPPTTPPGFTAGPPWGMRCLMHTHHPAGKVWPDDPGNQIWIAVTVRKEYSTSLDGDTWTPAAVIDSAATPRDIAYSAYGTRMVIVHHTSYIEYSDDNGFTWTAVSKPATLSPGLTQIRIATDGFGDWVVAETDGTDVLILGSYDNAETWHVVHLFTNPAVVNLALWYGGGRFNICVDDGILNFENHVSLRAGDP